MLLRAAPLRGVAVAQPFRSRRTAAPAQRCARSHGRAGALTLAVSSSMGGPDARGGARSGSQRVQSPAEAAGSASEARRLLALEQYAALKFELLKNTAGIGAGLSAYLAVAQHDVSSGVSVAVGVGGALAYLVLLGRHVDGLRPGSVRGFKPQRNPGENIVTVMLGAVQRVGDVYWNALGHPQLLVPVAIAAGGSAWNAADVGPDLQWIWVLVGFLSYKVAVLDQGWKALKAVTLYEKPSDRPVLKDLPDITDKLY